MVVNLNFPNAQDGLLVHLSYSHHPLVNQLSLWIVYPMDSLGCAWSEHFTDLVAKSLDGLFRYEYLRDQLATRSYASYDPVS
jgi:hypothetical protein